MRRVVTSAGKVLRGGLLAALVLLATLVPGRGTAQQVSRADSAAVLLAGARLLDARGETAAANALFQLIVDRFGDTPAALEASQRARSPGTSQSTRSGRVELQVWTTLYGLWLGVAVPAAFGADGPEAYGVGLLIGGPAGFLTGLGLARSRELSDGQARAITLGGTWGTWQGFGWAEVLDIGEGLTCDGDVCTSESSSEETFTAMIVGGIAGIVTGALLSRKDISQGVATTVNFGALWGTWFGFAAGYLADLEDDNLMAATLLGGDAGLLGTMILAPRWNMSRNRVRLISIAGVIGGLSGAGVDLIVQPDDDKVAVAIPMATSALGLLIGAVTTRNYDAQSGGGDDADAALLRFEHGRFALGAPAPVPMLLPVERAGRTRLAPAAGVTLFRARF